MADENVSTFFWEVAEPFLAQDTISKGTMMGFPCLRVNGDFFASADRHTGDLVIKLAKTRVEELIEADIGGPFAPNGRRFREWVVIATRDAAQWAELITEARAFVEGKA